MENKKPGKEKSDSDYEDYDWDDWGYNCDVCCDTGNDAGLPCEMPNCFRARPVIYRQR